MKTELILLAAGQSKRFGGIKQLADIRGQAMICHCLSEYRQSKNWLDGIQNGLVILGANAHKVSAVLPADIDIAVVETWYQGMGHTLAQSMAYISENTTHVLVGLADQVFITSTMFNRILALSCQHPEQIVAAHYSNRVGVPAIFPKRYFSHLSQLTGDKGAREILQQYQQKIIRVDMPEAAVDIDTQADLSLL